MREFQFTKRCFQDFVSPPPFPILLFDFPSSFPLAHPSLSFCDGRALLALCHQWESSVVDYNAFDKSNPERTITTALKLAEEHMKVPQLLDPKSLSQGDTKEKQVILYVSLIFNAFQAELEKRRRTPLSLLSPPLSLTPSSCW